MLGYLALKKLHCHHKQGIMKVFLVRGSTVRLKHGITRNG
jgi:hypothetical protein